jgi:hypothetical protein
MWQTSGANLVAAAIRDGQTPMEGVTYMNQQSQIVQGPTPMVGVTYMNQLPQIVQGPTPMVGVTYMNQQPQSQVSLVYRQQSPFGMVQQQNSFSMVSHQLSPGARCVSAFVRLVGGPFGNKSTQPVRNAIIEYFQRVNIDKNVATKCVVWAAFEGDKKFNACANDMLFGKNSPYMRRGYFGRVRLSKDVGVASWINCKIFSNEFQAAWLQQKIGSRFKLRKLDEHQFGTVVEALWEVVMEEYPTACAVIMQDYLSFCESRI